MDTKLKFILPILHISWEDRVSYVLFDQMFFEKKGHTVTLFWHRIKTNAQLKNPSISMLLSSGENFGNKYKAVTEILTFKK